MHVIQILSIVAVMLWAGTVHAAEKRVALVVGNGRYAGTASLENTVNDARGVADKLGKLGFDVVRVSDLDRREVIGALDRFSRDLNGADLALFYYAGHGLQIGGRNFLLPIDVDLSSERALRYSALDIQEIVSDMERLADVAVVVLDACRDNPFLDALSRSAGATRSVQVSRGLGPINLRGRGAIIAYAASAGETASDGTGSHSPYTAALLEEIDAPGVELGLMFRRVAGRVIDATRGAQRPELLVRLVDEVYLKPASTPLARGEAGEAVSPAVTAKEAVPTSTPLEVAQARVPGTQQSNGRSARASSFFGERVVRKPGWADGLVLPEPVQWRAPPAQTIAEAPARSSYGAAQPIPHSGALQLRLTPRRDENWYRFEVPIAGELRVLVEDPPPELDLHARVWNSDHKVAVDWQRAPSAGGVLDARFPIPAPGSFWLQITDGHQDAESAQLFTAQLNFVPALDRFEPNNRISHAQPVPLPSAFPVTLFPRRDHDWYRLWIQAPGLLSVDAQNVPKGLDVHFRLWDLDGKLVRDWVGPLRKGGDTAFEAELAIPGIYLLQLVDGHDDAASTKQFRVEIGFAPVMDTTEPNNSFGQAALREPTGKYRSAIFPRGDVDWLSFDIEHPGQLEILATALAPEIDIHARVWNADKAIVRDWIRPFRKGGDMEGIVDLPKPGRYFVEVSDGHSDASSAELFDLILTFTPQVDQYEPNNSMSEATPVTPGGEIAFNILPKGDTDWFRVEVASSGELAITIDKGPENLDLHFRVWNADRKLLRDWVPPYRKGGLTEGIVDLPGSGVYYVEISDGHADDRSIIHATLKTVFTATDDPLEPNDSFGQARPVEIGETISAYILPQGDTDWYMLTAPRSGQFIVTVEDVDKALDIHVRLWDAEGKAGGWTGPPRPGGVTEARLPVKAAGEYRLQIADGHSDARSAVPFRVKIDFE